MARLIVGLFFIVVPVLELVLLIKVGQRIGAWETVGLVVIMAFTGLLIISQQSLTVFRESLEAMSRGRPPVAQVIDGLFLFIAGVLLLTPGFISDALALVLLIPPLRRAIGRWGIERIIKGTHIENDREWQSADHGRGRPDGGQVIEGEFERLGEKPPPHHRSNGTSLH